MKPAHTAEEAHARQDLRGGRLPRWAEEAAAEDWLRWWTSEPGHCEEPQYLEG